MIDSLMPVLNSHGVLEAMKPVALQLPAANQTLFSPRHHKPKCQTLRYDITVLCRIA